MCCSYLQVSCTLMQPFWYMAYSGDVFLSPKQNYLAARLFFFSLMFLSSRTGLGCSLFISFSGMWAFSFSVAFREATSGFWSGCFLLVCFDFVRFQGCCCAYFTDPLFFISCLCGFLRLCHFLVLLSYCSLHNSLNHTEHMVFIFPMFNPPPHSLHSLLGKN